MTLTAKIHRLNQAISDEIAHAGSPLSKTQFLVLSEIAKCQMPSQTEIIAATGIDRSTLADVVRRLIRDGHVSRKRSRDDGRRDELFITEQGMAVLLTAKKCVRAAEKSALSKYRALRALLAEAAE